MTAIDVFSRYFFAYPTASQSADTIARVIINIMTKHAYLPTTIIWDKGSAFTSQVIKEVTNILGITLKHATTKHAQTIGMLERTHDALKRTLKIETGERRSMWHKYVAQICGWKNAMKAYLKNKAYYDKKANDSILKENDYVYILQLKAKQQGNKIPFSDFRSVGSYIVVRVLPNSNYVVRKIGTLRTKTLHRMRIRPFQTRTPLQTFSQRQKTGDPIQT